MLTFSTCFDREYDPGGRALVSSIRKLYRPDEAAIIVMLDEREYRDPFIAWMKHVGVLPMQVNGVNMFKAKAYTSAFAAMNIVRERETGILIHLDADALVLGRVDELLRMIPAPGDILAAADTCGEGLFGYEVMHGSPPGAELLSRAAQFIFNNGIMLYHVNRNVAAVLRSWADRCADEFLWAVLRKDQNMLRSTLADAVETGLVCLRVDPHGGWWNPVSANLDRLERRDGKWWNTVLNRQQVMWHGAGGRLPWVHDVHPSVKEAFKWATA